MSEIINAFHPDYIKTYHPNLMSEIRLDSRMTRAGQALTAHVEKTRETKPSHGTVFGISDKEVSLKPLSSISLAPTEYHTYSKAGAPKKKWNGPISKNIPAVKPGGM